MPTRRPFHAGGATAVARLTLALLAPAAALALPAGASAIGVDDYCADPEEQAFLDLVNGYRAQNGLGSLGLSQSLGAAAENHSLDMAGGGYFSHTGLDGSSVSDRAQGSGYLDGTVGENIAAGVPSAEEAFAMWQASPAHNANMLQPDFSAIGVGRAYEDGAGYGWYWTTVFGGELDASGTVCGGGASTEAESESESADASTAEIPTERANASSTDPLNLRAGAGPDNAILGIVPDDARLEVIGPEQNGYLPATYDGQVGWVLAEAVLLDGAPLPSTADSAIDAVLSNPVTTTETTPNTTTATTDPTTVLAAQEAPPVDTAPDPGADADVPTEPPAEAVSPPAPAAFAPVTVATALEDVLLRLDPSSDAAALAVIPAGTSLSLTGESGAGFLGVTYGGQSGWIDAAYLA